PAFSASLAATRWQRPIRAAAALLLVLPFLPTPSGVASARYDWLQYDGNAQHSGDNTQETALTVETVGRLHRLFRVPLPSFADGAPVYLHAVATPHGVRDLLLDGYVHKYAAGTGAEITGRGWPELVTREPAH